MPRFSSSLNKGRVRPSAGAGIWIARVVGWIVGPITQARCNLFPRSRESSITFDGAKQKQNSETEH